MRTRLILTLLFVCLAGPSAAAVNPDSLVLTHGQKYIQEFNKVLYSLSTPETNNSAVYFKSNGTPLRLVFLNRKAWLSTPEKRFTLRRINTLTKESAELGYHTPQLGYVNVRIETMNGEPLLVRHLAQGIALLTARPDEPAFLGNTTSRILHYRLCNHLADPSLLIPFSDITSAESRGYRKCPVCFSNTPELFLAKYDIERELGLNARAKVFETHRELQNAPSLQRLRDVGERVLAHWPLTLRGYRYEFGVVSSDEPESFACATGFILVSDAMMNTIEDDAELEALLAHDITHVERRHALQEYDLWVSSQNTGLWLSLMAGAIVANQGGNASSIDLAIRLGYSISMVAGGLIVSGHSIENEGEADAFANLYVRQDSTHQLQSGLDRLLSKLQYKESSYGRVPSAPGATTDYTDIATRIRRARETRLGLFDPELRYYGITSKGDTAIVIRPEAWTSAPITRSARDAGYDRSLGTPPPAFDVRLFCTVDGTGYLRERITVGGATLNIEGQPQTLDNYADTELYPNQTSAMAFHCRTPRQVDGASIANLAFGVPGIIKWVSSTP